MQEQLELIDDVLSGRSFEYQEKPHLQKKIYAFKSASVVRGKIKIETDSRAFILLPSEVEKFVSQCEVFEGKNKVKSIVVQKPIYVQNESFDKISNGLLSMFDKVASGEASDEDYKKAKAMVDISGKIIDMEKIKLSLIAKNM